MSADSRAPSLLQYMCSFMNDAGVDSGKFRAHNFSAIYGELTMPQYFYRPLRAGRFNPIEVSYAV